MTEPIPDAIMIEIIGRLSGTADSIERAIESVCEGKNIDPEMVEYQIADYGIERCTHCDWWCETCELWADRDDIPDGYCEGCRSDIFGDGDE